MPDTGTRWRVVALAAAAAAAAAAAWWSGPHAAHEDEAGRTARAEGPAAALSGRGFWDDPRLQVDLDAPPRAASAADAARRPAAAAAPSRGPDRWSVQDGRLRPGESLRLVFDDYLGRQGLTPAKARERLAADAAAAHGEAIAAEVLRLFDGYVALRDRKWAHPFLLSNRATWEPAWQEQKEARAQVLGAEWATAFFRMEDRAMQMLIQPGDAPPLSPDEDIALMFPEASASAVAGLQELRRQRLARFGEDVTRRLEQFEAEARDEQARLAEAHTEWARLRSLGYWTEAQRVEAMQAWIDSRFRDDERMKVRILLGLP